MNAKVDVDRNIGAPKNSERETIVPNEGILEQIKEMVSIINEGLQDVRELPIEYKVDHERQRVVFDAVLYNVSHADLRTRKYKDSAKGKVAVVTARKLYQIAEAGQDFKGTYYIIKLGEKA